MTGTGRLVSISPIACDGVSNLQSQWNEMSATSKLLPRTSSSSLSRCSSPSPCWPPLLCTCLSFTDGTLIRSPRLPGAHAFDSVYLMFEAYPIVFSVGHGFSAGITGLMFLGVFLGGVLSTLVYLVYFNPRYKKAHKRYSPEPTPPEVRIEFCLMAAPLLVIAFFVFGWTSYPTLSWVGPCIGGAILGAAVLAIFVSLFNYVSRLS
jgi:hypothetical protein